MPKRYLFAVLVILTFLGGVLSLFLFNRPKRELAALSVGGSLSVNTALLQIALDKGYFQDEGLDLTFRSYKSSQQALDVMLEGGVDLALSAETPVVFKAFEREDFAILASIISTYNDPKVLCLKSSGIEEPADLVGKRVGTTSRGQSAHYFFHLFMIKYEIDIDDVQLFFKSPSELAELLKRGELDGISLFEPHLSRTAAELGEDALVFSEPELYHKDLLLTGRDEFLKDNKELLVKFLKGLLRAEEFTLREREQALEIVARRCSVEYELVVELMLDADLEVILDQSLLHTLEGEARWNIESVGTDMGWEEPDFLELINSDILKSIKPEAVVIY